MNNLVLCVLCCAVLCCAMLRCAALCYHTGWDASPSCVPRALWYTVCIKSIDQSVSQLLQLSLTPTPVSGLPEGPDATSQ